MLPGAQIPRIFLLSPANAGGERARMILSDRANFDLAVRLRTQGAGIGEIFSFVSGLYFRGKMTYSVRFAAPPAGAAGALVITPDRGLIPAETIVTLADLRKMAEIPIDIAEKRYRIPLEQAARRINAESGGVCEFVLLGSVATGKYVEPLVEIFGERLVFPADFAGRGDMSRGGLLLRCARSGVELSYVPIANAVRRGPRPPKLPRLATRLDSGEHL
jgi:hypothetical protein